MPKSVENLVDFIARSPTPYHAVENLAVNLEQAGYKRLYEHNTWSPAPGKYYLSRNDSSLIAIKLSNSPARKGFRLIGAHTDSPCLKVKPNAISVNNGYAKLGVEVYGGALLNPWFDRDLGMAGRVTVGLKNGGIRNFLINIDHPIAFVPSLAIHLDRKANDHRSIDKQKHLPAVLCRTAMETMDFKSILHQQLEKQHPHQAFESILGFELSLYDCQKPSLVGLNQEFIASARLDNLLSCHAAIEALLQSGNTSNQIVVLNDHEEVGSGSTSGAEGPFLSSVLSRLCGEALPQALSHSMLVSADNAHGIHPNYPEVHEPAHQPLINQGPVIKINHNQRYATNSETEAVFRSACEVANVPCQSIVVRSDMGCGSTIGPITATRLGIRTVDVGAPQLAMHSVRELAGVQDAGYLCKALAGFLQYEAWPF